MIRKKDSRFIDSAPAPCTGYAWYVVSLFACFYVLSFIDRLIVGLMVEPIKADLGLSDTQISLVHGFSFALFYTLFGLLMGRLADRVNRRNLMAAGVVTWSFLTTLCGTAYRFWHLLLLRVGVGIGEAALTPAAYSMIADYFPKEKRSTALSIYSAGAYLGIAIAFTGGGYLYRFIESWLAARGGLTAPLLGSVHTWQIIFAVVGLPGLLFSTLLFTVREPLRRSDYVKNKEEEDRPPPFSEVLRYFRRNWKTVLGHNLGIAAISASAYSRDLWNVALFDRTYGWKLYQSGFWYGLIVVSAGILGVYTGGRIADRLARGKDVAANMKVMLFAALGWLPFGLTYPLMPTPQLSLVALFPTVFMTAMPYGCAAAAIQEMMFPRMRGFASALMLSANNIIGMGMGPTLVALLTDNVFANEADLRFSLVCVCGGMQILAAISFYGALTPFRKTIAAMKPPEFSIAMPPPVAHR